METTVPKNEEVKPRTGAEQKDALAEKLAKSPMSREGVVQNEKAQAETPANQAAISAGASALKRKMEKQVEEPEGEKVEVSYKDKKPTRRTLAQARADIEDELESLGNRQELIRQKMSELAVQSRATTLTIESLTNLLNKFS